MTNFSVDDRAASHPQRRRNISDILAKESEASEKETSYDHWADLVHRIRMGQPDALEELYQIFAKGIQFYLRRNTGTQDVEDRMHNSFLLTVQAIRRGELRAPERLMGFVRTLAQRQVAAHIRSSISARRGTDIESGREICAGGSCPEQAAIFREREELVKRVLSDLCERDREVLTRFYLKEQSPSRICVEMALTETQFRLVKSRAKARFGELGKKKLAVRSSVSATVLNPVGDSNFQATSRKAHAFPSPFVASQ